MKYKVTYFLTILSLLSVLTSCGVKRDNIVSRKYHSTTTFFNYYYNGELVWKEGVKEINKAYRVPPEGYIPVWWAGTEEDSKTFGDKFEQAIKKCEIAFAKHNQKKNKWIDDLNFLEGRSWFYKRNYILAVKYFDFVLDKYPDSKLTPDIYLWLVKTYYMDQNNTMALKILEDKLEKTYLKKKHRGELALIKAQVQLDEENYDEVIRTLNENKKNIKGKTNKARVHYLLGQIYADRNNFERAYENFKKVTKLNTDYELIFNAKISLAKVQIASDDGFVDDRKLRRYLKKMLRDEKNQDYLDRVYYELAMLDMKIGNQNSAIENLKSSIAANNGNQRQKALSYYKIGQIYFYDLKDFNHAQAYFDSASTAITKDAPEYREISTISATLKEYVKHVTAIQLNDSLLMLSEMSDGELSLYVDDIIEAKRKKEEEEAQKKLEELNRLNDPNLFQNTGNQGRGNSGWYFDSPELITSGKIDFQNTWGSRKNEDNWRRKNKALQISENVEEAVVEVSDEELEKYGSKEKAQMIKMVPRTEDEIASTHKKIQEALYGLGQVYDNKLNLADSAIATYTKLINRYPDCEYALKARYAMFKLYTDLEQEDKAKEYENAICGKFPDSRYCKLCRNEAFTDEEGSEAFLSAYTALYSTFDTKDYKTCLDFSNFIITNYPTSESLAEVWMIRGKSFAYLGQRDSLKKAYEYIKMNYPDSDVTPEVLRTLAFLNGENVAEEGTEDNGSNNNDGNNTGENVPEDDPRFEGFTDKIRPNEKLYAIMLIHKEKIASNELQMKLNEFNKTNFIDKRLNVSIFLYKNEYHLPYISQFNTKEEAIKYIKQVAEDEEIGALINKPDEKMVYISPSNFRTAYGKKRFEDYFIYYENVLLKK